MFAPISATRLPGWLTRSKACESPGGDHRWLQRCMDDRAARAPGHPLRGPERRTSADSRHQRNLRAGPAFPHCRCGSPARCRAFCVAHHRRRLQSEHHHQRRLPGLPRGAGNLNLAPLGRAGAALGRRSARHFVEEICIRLIFCSASRRFCYCYHAGIWNCPTQVVLASSFYPCHYQC